MGGSTSIRDFAHSAEPAKTGAKSDMIQAEGHPAVKKGTSTEIKDAVTGKVTKVNEVQKVQKHEHEEVHEDEDEDEDDDDDDEDDDEEDDEEESDEESDEEDEEMFTGDLCECGEPQKYKPTHHNLVGCSDDQCPFW